MIWKRESSTGVSGMTDGPSGYRQICRVDKEALGQWRVCKEEEEPNGLTGGILPPRDIATRPPLPTSLLHQNRASSHPCWSHVNLVQLCPQQAFLPDLRVSPCTGTEGLLDPGVVSSLLIVKI